MINIIRIVLFLGIIFYTFSQDMENQEEFNRDQEEYLNQFATAMSDFKPLQSFHFNLSRSDHQTLIFWPQNNVKELRGVFYVTQIVENQQEGENGLVIACYSGDKQIKVFHNHRIGVFRIPFQVGELKIIVSSTTKDIGIYISYQLRTNNMSLYQQIQKINQKQAKQTNTQNNTQYIQKQISQTQISKILKRFKSVQIQIQHQQSILFHINRYTQQWNNKIQEQIRWVHFRVILQTVIIIIGGIVCLAALRKKLNRGYQLLV